MIRTKELPELNDEFAQDLGDYPTLNDLREAVRKAIFHEREFARAAEGQGRTDRQADRGARFSGAGSLRRAPDRSPSDPAVQGSGGPRHRSRANSRSIGRSSKNRSAPRPCTTSKGSLLIDKVAERESIHATNDEVDHEVQRIAKQEREPVAAMRKKLEKDGILGRIAYRIRAEKTLNFLFEHARKEAAEPNKEELRRKTRITVRADLGAHT